MPKAWPCESGRRCNKITRCANVVVKGVMDVASKDEFDLVFLYKVMELFSVWRVDVVVMPKSGFGDVGYAVVEFIYQLWFNVDTKHTEIGHGESDGGW